VYRATRLACNTALKTLNVKRETFEAKQVSYNTNTAAF